MLIRPFQPGDELGICEVYNHYILNTVVTFEEAPLSPEAMRDRIDNLTQNHPWLVCVDNEQVVGYSYATKFHQRAAFRHTVESTVYVKPGFERRGIGHELYEPLWRRLKQIGCHAVIAAIALPNAASVALHERHGFVKAGHLHRVGHKFGRWIDLGYFEKHLD